LYNAANFVSDACEICDAQAVGYRWWRHVIQGQNCYTSYVLS